MSFVTKRERVFNDYDLFDLPARNEGKLKAYASCTDARAWSHFGSDKTEHLVEIIKRNNDTCRPKYIPTDVIVDTLLVAKNTEIGRLRRKIEEFEQMVEAYDQLELTSEQKCEIADAHAAIKAANKDLDDMFLDLDISGFTEGMESDAFETGKSRGDEPAKPKTDEWVVQKTPPPPPNPSQNKSNQTETSQASDASTSADDPRVQKMKDQLINKDAKLCAMQNTIAVMENDVCEPYCIYAHIYTALEKIFGILCQNDKYKLYLNLMTAGKDTRCIDIKGKIMFKLKVLEKFCQALIAPCSQAQEQASASQQNCSCYRAEVLQQLIPTSAYALTSAEIKNPNLDNKRAYLVADIMENEDMKEILNKESDTKMGDETDEFIDDYDIETENLKRLKNLQDDYNDLMVCYEALKHEKENLLMKCQKFDELDKEYVTLRDQLREYNLLWNEKEHYRKRSADLDSLKEQYLILTDETANMETQLKADSEIIKIKANTIEELRHENVALEKKVNDAIIAFEKEKSLLQCQLKESECKCMCQDQQIKSLSIQIDRLLEQEPEKVQTHGDPAETLILIDEVESLKDQILNLKDVLCCSEEEKQNLNDEFQNNLKIINDLRMEIEDWKSNYEKAIHRNNDLEEYVQHFEEDMNKLKNENNQLSLDVIDKTTAVSNLINVIDGKSQEINRLLGYIDIKKRENKKLFMQLHDIRDSYDSNVSAIENEKKDVIDSLKLAKRESAELLSKLKDYDDVVQSQCDMSKSLEAQIESYNQLKKDLLNTIEENKNLQIDLIDRDQNRDLLLNKIQRLQENHSYAVTNIEEEKNKYKASFELTRKKSELLEDQLMNFESLSQELQSLKEKYEKITAEKIKLEKDLLDARQKLQDAIYSTEISNKASIELKTKLSQSESIADEFSRLTDAHNKLIREKEELNKELTDKNNELLNSQQSLDKFKENENYLLQKSNEVSDLEQKITELQKSYSRLNFENQSLQKHVEDQNEDLKNLYNNLEMKLKENTNLADEITYLKSKLNVLQNDLRDLRNENISTKTSLTAVKKESDELFDKLKYYECLENDFKKLHLEHNQIKMEKDRLQADLDFQLNNMKQFEQKNIELQRECQTLMRHSEDLENTLVDARTQLIEKADVPDQYLVIKAEIEGMKKEKNKNLQRIRDLSNDLDETENVISNLTQDLLAREDKIAVLENYINKLKDEVTHLHSCLSVVIDTGEQLTSASYDNIGQSLQNIEAHHSKATHNMKMEISNLQNDKVRLKAQMSLTKLKTEESIRDFDRHKSLLTKLQNEREFIVTDIKELELQCVGDSSLSPVSCDIEDILRSLDRLREVINAKNSKTISLEQALMNVQRSSRELVSEAKELIEKEKQKILNEKEEAIRDKQYLQKQLEDQRSNLETQISEDQKMIKDLEAEVLNQELIIGKINASTADYISKLEGELHSLKKLYQNSMKQVKDLQEKNTLEHSNKNGEMIEILNLELNQKCNDIKGLQDELEMLKNKDTRNYATQTGMPTNKSHTSVQTEKEIIDKALHSKETHSNDTDLLRCKNSDENNMLSILPKHRPHSINEVQILTANVEPTFDFFKNCYLRDKLKSLSIGRLEKHSISNNEMSAQKEDAQYSGSLSYNTEQLHTEDNGIVDLYNRQSLHTDSSKVECRDTGTSESKTNYKETTHTSVFGESDQTNSFKVDAGTESEKVIDNDLFIIYKESETDFENKPHNERHPFNVNKRSKNTVASSKKGERKKKFRDNNKNNKHQKKKYNAQEVYEEEDEDDSVKPKLNIKLPRVATDSVSIPTTSDGDRKSLDSYTMAVYMSPKETLSDNKIKATRLEKTVSQETPSLPTLSNEENRFTGSNNSFRVPVYDSPIEQNVAIQYNKTPDRNNKKNSELSDQSKSVHKLSRVGADVFLIKSRDNVNNHKKEIKEDGLQYILDTMKKESDGELPETLSYNKTVHKSYSDGLFNHALKESEKNSQINANPSILSPGRVSKNTQPRSYIERSVMAKIDNIEGLEAQIVFLTKTLENVDNEYKKKIEAIKIQYDSNIKSIINEHNTGVKSIQNLHEETLQDIIKIHENEVENLRTLSIEAMSKSEKLEKENRSLKCKLPDFSPPFEIEPTRICCNDNKKRRKSRTETHTLTKTNVEAFNVKPKVKSHGPCTCSLDINLSDTIRNIFEQVDMDQRKMAENTYLKYIANKILTSTVETLDTQELSFLHLKVCRTWKLKLNKEETLQKKINSLELELMNKQRNAQQHIAELDLKVAEERRRLQEMREAVCRSPRDSRSVSPSLPLPTAPIVPPSTTTEKNQLCGCNTGTEELKINERRSAGDLAVGISAKPKRVKEINRAVLARLDADERRDKRLYHDEPPTRLRRGQPLQSSYERQHRYKKI